jgi:transketolase
MTLRLGDHCAQQLARLAEQDLRIWVLDGDLADSDGAQHFARCHPQRFLMAGIAEQAMVSMAAGMASCGRRPWVFSFAAFLCYRAYDQVRVCLSQANQPVALVGSHSGGCANRNGRSHAALNDLSLMASLPNMAVWAPADRADVHLAVRSVLDSHGPAYLRLPRRPVDDLPAPVALLGTGLGTHLAVAAAEELTRRGQRVGVVHCPQVAPLPRAALTMILGQIEHLFTIEDHYRVGGLASLILHTGLARQTTAIGWPPQWTGQSGDDSDLLTAHGLDASSLADQVIASLASRRLSRPSWN